MFDIKELSVKLSNHARAERIAFIDFKVRFEGRIMRSSLKEEFGISEPIASKDISCYKAITNGRNVASDKSTKVNVIDIENYQPLINLQAQDALYMLVEGFNRNRLKKYCSPSFIRICEKPNNLSIEYISVVTRAIIGKKMIAVGYKINGSLERLELAPVCVFFDGSNWMFRAKNIRRNVFGNFYLSSLDSVEELNCSLDVTLADDMEWNTMIPIHLQLHPSLDDHEKSVIKASYNMTGEDKVVVEKAIFASALFDNWRVDTSSQKENPVAHTYHYSFYLKNADILNMLSS